MTLQESNITVLRNKNQDRAVVFIHSFTGSRDDTWDRFPGLLGSSTPDWDIFTVGYATTLLPDVVGIWSADPDLPILNKMFSTELQTPPFAQYKSLALIAHSMGGLVVQKALLDDQTSPAEYCTLYSSVRQVRDCVRPAGCLSGNFSLKTWPKAAASPPNCAPGGKTLMVRSLRLAFLLLQVQATSSFPQLRRSHRSIRMRNVLAWAIT